MTPPSRPSPPPAGAPARPEADRAALQARVGLRLAQVLHRQPLPAGVPERLRMAREQALQRARQAAPAPQRRTASPWALAQAGGPAPDTPSRWQRALGWAPLVLLVVGLWAVQQRHHGQQAHGAAEIDALLLADDLPPHAWSDPGFAAYLRYAPRREQP
jgi:hypothetical protein